MLGSTIAMDDDVGLLAAWRGGDRAAGSRLLRRHFGSVFGFFAARVGTELAEELSQRVFATCVETRERIAAGVGVKAYLLGIARNKLLQHHDEWRRRDRHATAPGDSLVAPGPSVSAAVAMGQQQRQLVRALARLPLDFQVAIELHYWEALTVVEIAHVLGIPSGTVKSRLARARAQLEQTITALGEDPVLTATTLGGLEGWIASLRRRADPEAT